MPPVEAWEKVFVSNEPMLESIHGRYGCITCHGGVGGTDDMGAAHEGIVRDPEADQACVDCHPDPVAANPVSLHTTQAGYYTVLEARSTPDKMAQIEVAMENHCLECHSSCGQCHVSRPTNLGGGLSAGHEFKKIPPMNLTCTGCHGSRVNDEYKGMNEGVPADVHWVKGGMPCFDCHSAAEMHGAMGEFNHRYDGPPTPSCTAEGCHDGVMPGDGIEQHDEEHLQALSCEACHSTTYKNCYSCHVALDQGVTPYRTLPPAEMAFKIGFNPIQSQDRPWKYVPVRHIPIDRDTFAYYGQDLLPNFDALPTWKYATPHNTQRITPQNESCNACHGNPEVFLMADDVLPDELEANQPVIVQEVPELVEE